MRRHHSFSKRAKAGSRSIPVALAVAAACGTLGGLSASAQVPPAPSATVPETGVWLDDTQQGAVEIYICQDRADRLCGRIVWLRDPLNAEGKPKFDRYNPNAAMQGRPICGLPVIGNLAKSSDGGFDDGWIYDPKTGKSYSAAITLNGANTLTVTGYLGMKFMGKSFTWTRAPDGLQRCSNGPQPVKTAPQAAPAPQKPVTATAPAQAPQSSQGVAPASQKQPQAAPAKQKSQTATPGQGVTPAPGSASQKAQQATTSAAKPQQAKPQAKPATAVSASPVITQPPAPAKKPAAPAAEAEALPWQVR